MKHLRRWIVAAAVCVALWACWGCGTIRGIGTDLQTVGAWLEESSGP